MVKVIEPNKLKSKRTLLLLLFFMSTLFLSGCWDRTEINDLSIITAVAIDKAEDNQVEVTVQIFVPKALSSGGGQGGGGNANNSVSIASQVGSNIADALSKLQEKIPRRLFWGQTKVFIFSEKVAEEGIQDHMDFLERLPQIKENAFIYVSEENAKKILDVPANIERYSSEVIRALTDRKIGVQTTVKDLDVMLMGIGQAAILPYVKIGKQEQKHGESIKYIFIAGSAIFQKDKMVGKISDKETRGILWLRDEMEEATVNIKLEDEKELISILSVNSKTKLHPQIKNGVWKMQVEVKTDGSIEQNETKLNISSPEVMKKVEKAYKEEVKKLMRVSLSQVQQEYKADVTHFAEEFYRKYPQQMKREKKDWTKKYPNVEVVFNVEVNIRREGNITQPGGLPEDEVKEN